MKKQLLLAAGFATIMLFSCKKEEEPIPARFLPLAEGNQWTTIEEYSWSVPLIGSDTNSSSTTNAVKPWEKREDGKLVWPVEVSTDTSGSGTGLIISRNYYYVTDDSVYLYTTKDADKPSMVEPQDLAVGVEWDGNLALPIEIPNVPTEYPAHFKVIDQGEAKVPAGTFNCLIIQINLPDADVDSAATQWRAEGVGVVKLSVDFQYIAKIQGISEMQSKTGF